MDSDLVHILAETKLQGYSELLRGDYSKEKFMEIFRMLKICSCQSFLAVAEEISTKQ